MAPIAPPEGAWTEWGGDGPVAIFGHANGFPPESYRMLLENLRSSVSIVSFAARPLWPESDPFSVGSWRDLANDLGGEMDRHGVTAAVGIGHSLGSVLNILAAAADRRRFRALAMVDPVVFSGLHGLSWGLLKGLGLGPRLPLIRGARRRREVFAGLDEVRRSYSTKSVFATWDERVLGDYIGAAFREVEDGAVRLRYPKAWESRIFELTPSNVWPELRRLEIPMLFIRGAVSDTFLAPAMAKAARELPTARVTEFPGCSHFVPMEKPLEVAGLIADWIRGVGL